MIKSQQKKLPTALYLVLSMTVGASLLYFGLQEPSRSQLAHAGATGLSQHKGAMPNFVHLYAHRAARKLFLGSLFNNDNNAAANNGQATPAAAHPQGDLSGLNPMDNFNKFKNEVANAKSNSKTTGEMIANALHITEAIERLKNGDWSSMLSSLAGGKGSGGQGFGAGDLMNAIFSPGKGMEPATSAGNQAPPAQALTNGIKNAMSSFGSIFGGGHRAASPNHKFLSSFNLHDEVKNAYNMHQAVDEKVNLADTMVQKIAGFSKILQELGKGEYAGLISSVLSQNSNSGANNNGNNSQGGFLGGVMSTLFGSSKNNNNNAGQTQQGAKQQPSKGGFFSGWFLYSLKQIELDTQTPENLKQIMMETTGPMNPYQHKSTIERGNNQLLEFFKQIQDGDMKANKNKIEKLYKHMANPKFAIDSETKKLAHYLKHLKWVAKVTGSARMNEFLGTFDTLCEVVYHNA